MKIYIFIVVLFISFLSYGIINKKENNPKSKRVECQEKVTTFEKIFDNNLKSQKELLLTNNYEIISNIEYSKAMKSNLKNSYSTKNSDIILEKILKNHKTHNMSSEKKLQISYTIYENDKNDSGKKNKDAFLYAGYLLFEFKFKNDLLYKIQIDYMNIDASDIEERMMCAVDSFLSI